MCVRVYAHGVELKSADFEDEEFHLADFLQEASPLGKLVRRNAKRYFARYIAMYPARYSARYPARAGLAIPWQSGRS